MFTGIIEGLGSIKMASGQSQGRRLVIEAEFSLSKTKIGDSVAVNGACLTVVSLDRNRFAVDVSPETLSRTTLGVIGQGDRVNLERALKLSDRLDGHIVSGHIDGIGTIVEKTSSGRWIMVTFSAPEAITRYMIEKGSVAIDGISLTINTCGRNRFGISVIPHTAKLTTIGFKSVGDRVNLETDLIGKYVEKLLGPFQGNTEKKGIDINFLTKTGFL
jgi:riboflavin synthase